MKSAASKQYLMLGDLPILSRTLLAIDACPEIEDTCLVVLESDMDHCREAVLKPIRLRAPVRLVAGGACRQESVYNGLSTLLHDDGIVLIHDGVRPFVPTEGIRRCIAAARIHGACVPGVPVSDTLKAVDANGDIIRTVDRGSLWHAQTPQAFQSRLIRKAHETARQDGVTGTDDASLVERLGMKVHLVPGSIFNIKITTQEDLKMAETIAKDFLQKHQ